MEDGSLDSCHYLDEDKNTQICDAWIYDTTYYQSSRAIEVGIPSSEGLISVHFSLSPQVA